MWQEWRKKITTKSGKFLGLASLVTADNLSNFCLYMLGAQGLKIPFFPHKCINPDMTPLNSTCSVPFPAGANGIKPVQRKNKILCLSSDKSRNSFQDVILGEWALSSESCERLRMRAGSEVFTSLHSQQTLSLHSQPQTGRGCREQGPVLVICSSVKCLRSR